MTIRLSISNLAWEASEDDAVAEVLATHRIDAIDVAPSRYFGNPARVDLSEIKGVRKRWEARGVEIVGMQSLLFGTAGLNVFGDETSSRGLLSHLEGVCRLGRVLGARFLVFGSPKNRDRSALDDRAAIAAASRLFGALGDIAQECGVVICLEPNPARYGCNFLTTTKETMEFVQQLAHPGIRLQLDTGAATVNDEPIDATVAACADVVAHVHASEPDLRVLGEGGCRHQAFGEAITRSFPGAIVTVEMLKPVGRSAVDAVDQALAIAVENYLAAADSDP